MNYQERITIEAGKRGGRPCIRGLRITVYDVLEQMAAGLSPKELLEDFPELEADDISLVKGAPPRIIWLKSGNTTKSAVTEILLANKSYIEQVLTTIDTPCVELY